ncbi:MAG TPA: hypothetical protein DCS93_33385 [Microscillaceae bacterium]|nr:hypothetical protein [Microscillaceae bacterium]
MSETTYKYEKILPYVPFKKRYLRASRLFFIFQGLLLVMFLSISLQYRIFSILLMGICAVALVSVIYIFRIRKKTKYFLQSIKITQDHVVSMEMYRKDEKFDHQVNLENLDVDFEVTGGGRRGRLTFTIVFAYNDQLLGQQSDLGKWKTSEVKELYSSIKQYKGESLTPKEADLLKMKRRLLG